MIYVSIFGGTSGPPAFRSNGSIGAESSSDLFAVGYPTGVQTGDILFLHLSLTDAFGNADVSSLSDAGFALVGTTFSSDTHSKLYWKRATGLESGSIQVNLTEPLSLDIGAGIMSAWPSCITSGTPYEDATINANASASTSVTGAVVDTTGPNRRVVSFFSHTHIAASGTNTNGWDENYDVPTAVGDDVTLSCSSVLATSAGTVSACTRTLDSAGVNICHTLALIPA